MRTIPRISPVLFFHACVVTFATLVVSLSHAACPTTDVICQGAITFEYHLPDSAANGHCSSAGGEATWQFDHPHGTLSVTGNGYSDAASITAHDDYVVTGLPAGTPLSFRARLEVRVSQCTPENCSGACFGAASAELAMGSSRVSVMAPGGTGCHEVAQVLEIPLSHLAGETFQLELKVSAQGLRYGSGSASGTLSFIGLPPEAGVASCKGFFRQDRPTAVKPIGWGTLKAIYR